MASRPHAGFPLPSADISACLTTLSRLVGSDLTTLSVCDLDLDTGHRSVLLSFVFNRRGRDFSDGDGDRARLEAIRPLLGDLFRLGRAMEVARSPQWSPSPMADLPLTAREREVLHWLAGGKTDKDIGDILGISPRTVHKHLQRIYEKLGVETRTAAVARAMGQARIG